MDGRGQITSDARLAVRQDLNLSASQSGVRPLGQGIWVGEAGGPPVRMIGGRPHFRFLNRLYLPAATHRLSPEQVITVNHFRNTIIRSDPQFEYNRAVRSIFEAVVERASGPVLEVGPGLDPVLRPDFPPGAVLCDLDESANRSNAALGYVAVTPDQLTQLAPGAFQLIIASFALHFALDPSGARSLVNLLQPAGVTMFNVITKSAATRTDAVSRLSAAGLQFRSFELEPLLGKADVMFVGARSDAPSAFQADIYNFLTNVGSSDIGRLSCA